MSYCLLKLTSWIKNRSSKVRFLNQGAEKNRIRNCYFQLPSPIPPITLTGGSEGSSKETDKRFHDIF